MGQPSRAVQAPVTAHVGRVAVVFWGADRAPALALAEYADGAGPWPGITGEDTLPLRLVLTRSRSRFDSLTRGALPAWTGAVAYPRTGTIVLHLAGDPIGTLRHELAHIALGRATRGRVPLWFQEGYAAYAAQEWDRLDGLAVNWALVRGRIPSFAALNRELRAGPAHAQAAYALATTAILFLQRLGGKRGLEPLLAALSDAPGLDLAVRRSYLVSLDQLEAMWHRDLRARYGWLRLVTSLGLFWSATALLVGVAWWRRRRRDRERRARLDEGWIVPSDPPSHDA